MKALVALRAGGAVRSCTDAGERGAGMPELPTGTVTFLFTDLEGSTRLWEEHPEAMKGPLARHDEIVQAAVERHDGHVVNTTGDGLHAAFARGLGSRHGRRRNIAAIRAFRGSLLRTRRLTLRANLGGGSRSGARPTSWSLTWASSAT